MESEDKLIAILTICIFLFSMLCIYTLGVISPKVEAESKVLVLQELNKTLQILKDANLSPEDEKKCQEKLAVLFGKESEEGK